MTGGWDKSAAADLARKAIAAAERRSRATDIRGDLRDRLSAVADEDGRVTIEQALAIARERSA